MKSDVGIWEVRYIYCKNISIKCKKKLQHPGKHYLCTKNLNKNEQKNRLNFCKSCTYIVTVTMIYKLCHFKNDMKLMPHGAK